MKVPFTRIFMLLIALGSGLLVNAALAQDTNSYLYIANAVSGRELSSTNNPAYPVDIALAGTCVAKGVSYGDIGGPYVVAAGRFMIAITKADAASPCGGASVFSTLGGTSPGVTYLGVLALNASNTIVGLLYSINLTGLNSFEERFEVVNTTTSSLHATISANGGTGTLQLPASTIDTGTAVGGIFTAAIWDSSNNQVAGPAIVPAQPQNVYIYVVAGSEANHSIQLLGPAVIHGVF